MSHEPRHRRRIEEACREGGLDHEIVIEFISHEWITPQGEWIDEEDVARARLIIELRQDFGVNDEAVPLILHLIDELNALRRELRERAV